MKQRLCLGPHFLVPVYLALTEAAHLRVCLVLLPGNLPHLLYPVLINGKGGQTVEKMPHSFSSSPPWMSMDFAVYPNLFSP